jgi:hypothetical protein
MMGLVKCLNATLKLGGMLMRLAARSPQEV